MPDLTPFIEALIDAHLTRSRFRPEGDLPTSRTEALEVQAEVQKALGAVGGFKVGADEPGLPLLAPIPEARVFDSGATWECRDKLGVELEVGFELIQPLPEEGGFPDRPELYFRPRPVLELCDRRIEGPLANERLPKLADMQVNEGLVLGPPLEPWDGLDFGTLTARLSSGAMTPIDGEGTVPGGSALANLALLCAAVGDHCGGLQVGQVVITGSLCGCPWFEKGSVITGRIDGLGEVTVTIA